MRDEDIAFLAMQIFDEIARHQATREPLLLSKIEAVIRENVAPVQKARTVPAKPLWETDPWTHAVPVGEVFEVPQSQLCKPFQWSGVREYQTIVACTNGELGVRYRRTS
jgi:hypothetical protein